MNKRALQIGLLLILQLIIKFNFGQMVYQSLEWSRDNHSIAYSASLRTDLQKTRGKSLNIYEKNMNTGDSVLLAEGATNPAYSHDGKMVAYSIYNGDYTNIEILNIKTKEKTRVSNGDFYDTYPCFSPDDTKIAFSRTEKGIGNLLIADIHSRSLERLTPDSFNVYDPQWIKPDQILYFESKIPRRSQVCSIDPVTKTWIRITNDTLNNFFPAWNEKLQIIYYISVENGKRGLFSMNVNGAQKMKLMPEIDNPVFARISDDGRFAAIIGGSPQAIYIANLKDNTYRKLAN